MAVAAAVAASRTMVLRNCILKLLGCPWFGRACSEVDNDVYVFGCSS